MSGVPRNGHGSGLDAYQGVGSRQAGPKKQLEATALQAYQAATNTSSASSSCETPETCFTALFAQALTSKLAAGSQYWADEGL